MIIKSSETIKADIEKGVGSGVFPSPESVQNFFSEGAPTPRYNGTTGTGDENCTSYTVVPRGGSPSDENSSTADDGLGKPKNKANPPKWTSET